jgi:hypothetical protein
VPSGKQFGSRYPGDPARLTVYDFLPDEQLRETENLADFAGMLVFDKWTCNTNGRQAVFFDRAGTLALSGHDDRSGFLLQRRASGIFRTRPCAGFIRATACMST